MMVEKHHSYHMVDPSPWPVMSSFSALVLMTGYIKMFQVKSYNILMMGIMLLIFSSYQWWRDIVRESFLQGLHSIFVVKGLKMGMILFIISEIFFFLSMFWAFFHSSLSPNSELGLIWPPNNIMAFDMFKIPLLNTLILLSSGATLTVAHHCVLNLNNKLSIKMLFMTVLLGVYFTMFQCVEYLESFFCLSDSTYGSVFFMATGFHGVHVIIGSLFLLICLFRLSAAHFSELHHFGMEAAAWYWHFVDVVWLFLFLTVYWWGS